MRVLSIIIGAVLFFSSCVTQQKVENYASKHPERMSKVATEYMDKNRTQAAAYCSFRFPINTTGTSVEVIIDTAAMTEIANELTAQMVAANDSTWKEILKSEYIKRDTVVAIISAMQKKADERVKIAIDKTLDQCYQVSKTVIRDTVEDLSKVMACEERYSLLSQERDHFLKDRDAQKSDKEKYEQKYKNWMGYAIGTWSLMLAVIAAFIIGYIGRKTRLPVSS